MELQQTSLFAYKNEIQPTLGSRQYLVFEELEHHDNCTNNELSHYLNFPINTITPRVNELRKLGMVDLAETRKCKITGRTCCAWKIK